MIINKSWGKYKPLNVDNESLTVLVTLDAGQSMKYHSHVNRDEVWTIVSGQGKTTVDGMEQIVNSGDVISIAAGCRHTIEAITDLKLIEVQIGKNISVTDKHVYELRK